MGILKWFGEVFKQVFVDEVKVVKAFCEKVNPPKNYQKEIAENTKKLAELLDSREK